MPDNKYRVMLDLTSGEPEWLFEFGLTGSSAAEIANKFDTNDGNLYYAFMVALAQIHAVNVRIRAVSVRNLQTGLRDSRTRRIDYAVGVASLSDETRWPDIAATSMISRMYSNAGYARPCTLSGLPDAMITRDGTGKDVRNALFNAAWEPLKTAFFAMSPQLIFMKPPPGTGGPEDFKAVRLMTPDSVTVAGTPTEDTTRTVFNIGTGHLIAVDDVVIFRQRPRQKQTRWLTNSFQVQAVGAETITVITPVEFRGTSFVPTKLKCRKVTFDMDPITEWDWGGWGVRERGQGSGPRGKAKSHR